MKISSYLLVTAAVLCMVSCSENKDSENSAEMELNDNTEVYEPESESTMDMGQTQMMDTTAQQQATGRLNPAHGEPGHRCDIQVGAPLDAPAGQPTQPQMNMQQQNTSTTSGKINPAHGEPGHDCSVAVGAPLN